MVHPRFPVLITSLVDYIIRLEYKFYCAISSLVLRLNFKACYILYMLLKVESDLATRPTQSGQFETETPVQCRQLGNTQEISDQIFLLIKTNENVHCTVPSRDIIY